MEAITDFRRCTGFGVKPADISILGEGFTGVDKVDCDEGTEAFRLPLFDPSEIGEPNTRDMARATATSQTSSKCLASLISCSLASVLWVYPRGFE